MSELVAFVTASEGTPRANHNTPHLLRSLRQPKTSESRGGPLRIVAIGLVMIGAVVIGFAGGLYVRLLVERSTAFQTASNKVVPGRSEALTDPVSVATTSKNTTAAVRRERQSSAMLRGLAHYQRLQLKAIADEEGTTTAAHPPVSQHPSNRSATVMLEEPSPPAIARKQKPKRPATAPRPSFTPHNYWDAPGYSAR